jgi:hypothetical protein
MVFTRWTCQTPSSTIYWAYGKQAWSIPTECHVCTSFHCYPFSLMLYTFFHPVMATTQIVVLTGYSSTAFNLILEISAVVLVISNQQTKTGDVLIIFCHIHVAGCCRQAVHITYSECVCVWLYSCDSYPVCKVYVPHYIVICDLSGCTIFFLYYLIHGAIFGKSYST